MEETKQSIDSHYECLHKGLIQGLALNMGSSPCTRAPETYHATKKPTPHPIQYSFPKSKFCLTCRPAQFVPESNFGPDSFQIDHYFGLWTNRDVYSEVEPLIDIVVNGYDVYILTDGQSDSGKSWTMFKGTDAIAPFVAAFVMAWKDAEVPEGRERDNKCSAIETYNDRLKDLLDTENYSGEESAKISKAKQGHYDKSISSVEAFFDLFQLVVNRTLSHMQSVYPERQQ